MLQHDFSPVKLHPERPEAMLRECPAHKVTPLNSHDISGSTLLVKDETGRMGLGAFKALGGVYALSQLIAEECGGSLEPHEFLTAKTRKVAETMTFICASAGNHGIAVAAGAKLFGAKARIHLAHSVPEDFVARLEEKGAEVVRSGDTYEESNDAAMADARSTGGIHLADGSWEGYTEIPRTVMEGYSVMAEEMRKHFEEHGGWPTHVYLQAGVGGLAGGIAYMIRDNWKVQPRIIIVEPAAAPCIVQSIKQGEMITTPGPVSNMGRLDCKTPSILAFEILKDAADDFVQLSEEEGLASVTQAADLGYSSTPSGAAGLAAFLLAQNKPERALVIMSECGVDGD